MYSTIKPFKSGLLEVKDGNTIYWEISGNTDGVPALFIHGGPGGGFSEGHGGVKIGNEITRDLNI